SFGGGATATLSGSAGAINSNGAHAHEGIEGMDWSTVPISVLHRYRHAYRLRVPSASPFYNHLILSQGVGKRTPSRAGYTLASGLGGLATVVRKNFNAQPINESDVIVNFLYSVKNQDKTFRLRFPP
ncbi:hypothetical protein BDZ91DRAFT_641857, partial [Kalaharituber pfeilii]